MQFGYNQPSGFKRRLLKFCKDDGRMDDGRPTDGQRSLPIL